MFNSQSLLSKKGALGSIWTAAHSAKRLKKEHVFQTDISSSVDKILLDEFPTVAYRILAFLLLGLVRIFSKKERFELDAFDLEVIETSSGDHTTPREVITQKGTKKGVWLRPVEQYHFEDALHFEDFSAGHTPIKDIYSPYSTTIDVVASTSHNPSNMVEGCRKKLRNKRFSLKECWPPYAI